MHEKYFLFAEKLTDEVVKHSENMHHLMGKPTNIGIIRNLKDAPTFELEPFSASPAKATAYSFFDGVENIPQLILAYQAARGSRIFETDIVEAMKNVSAFSSKFLNDILQQAPLQFTDQQAQIIAQWVKHLDIYTAVKSVESLLNSKADLSLLEISHDLGWNIHFDHLAIRCGSRARKDAERVVELLTEEHGFVSAQLEQEAFYQFTDGWNAYPLYKILDNGQVLRIFVDQSDSEDKEQIIQHWNHIYGYTAHHLAMRATQIHNNVRRAVPLELIIRELECRGVSILTSTGQYTEGLLLQVFSKPERNEEYSAEVIKEWRHYDEKLLAQIKNGKLLELVSRKEMSPLLSQDYFQLYNLEYDINNPLHSAPIYQYFLPAQATHVINTSIQT